MKTIILPVDFSRHSEYALETAAALAKKHNAKLIVMHMLELSESMITQSDSDRNNEMLFMMAHANKQFETFLDQPYLKEVNLLPIIKHHKVLKEVDTLAKAEGADLIIMGSRGLSDHDGIFTGSNTEKVVRYSETPVLVVKEKNNTLDFDNVVLATDFSKESMPAFRKAVTLLNELGGNFTLLHVNTPGSKFNSTDEIELKVSKFLFETGTKNWKDKVNFISDYSVEDGILHYATKTNASVVALITHGRTGLSHFFGGSIAEDLANHSRLPILTFKM